MSEVEKVIPLQWPHQSTVDAFRAGEFGTNVTEPWTQALIRRLMWTYQAERVLEIGSFTGLTSSWLAQGLEESGGGELILVEPNEDYREETLDRLADLDLPRTEIRMIPLRAVEALHEIEDGSLDFAYLDFLAEGAEIKPVLEGLWSWYDHESPQKMKPGKLILVHDVSKADVRSAVIGHQGFCLDIPQMHTEGGLGLIQLPS